MIIYKKVAIFHTEFAYSGGAERLVFEHYKFFKSKEFDPEIYTSSVDSVKCFPNEIGDYKMVKLVPEFFLRIFTHEFLILLSFIFLPFWFFKLRKFDFIFAENQVSPWWAYVVSKVFRTKYFVYQNYPTTVVYPRKIDINVVRNVWYVDLIIKAFKPIIIGFDKLVIKNAIVRFTNGKYVTKVCEKAYNLNFINCAGGTNLGKFNKTIFLNRYKNPYVLIANRHFPAKDFETGILAVSKYKFNLKIAGLETEYTKKLKRLVNELKLNNYVKFLGLIEKGEKEKIYEKALVFLYTAPEEDFGLGNIEALAHGVPVVAWNNAGPKYIIKDGLNGYLAKLGDINDFALKIDKIINNKRLNYCLSRNAYKEGLKYTWEKHNNIIWTTLKEHIRF